MNKHENRSADGRWLKGTTGNASGRPLAARQRIPEKLLLKLASGWETHGESILSCLALYEKTR